jgi:hypothetical protein
LKSLIGVTSAFRSAAVAVPIELELPSMLPPLLPPALARGDGLDRSEEPADDLPDAAVREALTDRGATVPV